MRLKSLICGSASALLLTGVLAAAANAQTTAAPATPATSDQTDQPTSVDALTVMAQKREQKLQDVPIVDNVASKQALQDADVSDIRQLAILVPGMTVTATSSEGSVTARIRGVGTVGDNPGLESSVGVVIDDVYRPRDGVGFGDLGDLDHIEVLKGPQGTLFGKNTSAGVINIFTAEPSFTPLGEAEVTAGNYNTYGASGYVSGPIVADKLAGSLYLADRQRDGFLDVATLGGARSSDDDNRNYYTGRAQLLALPNNDFSLRLIADYTKHNEDCCGATQLFVGTAAGSRASIINTLVPGSIDLTSTPFDRQAYANRPDTQDITDEGVSAEGSYKFDGMTLTSITADRGWKLISGQDTDFTAADLLYRPNDGRTYTDFDQLSQEFRLAGQSGKLNWLVGAFGASENLGEGLPLLYGTNFYNYLSTVLHGVPGMIGITPTNYFQPGAGSADVHHQDDKTYAFFTNNDYALTDQLTATIGLRYTNDQKAALSNYHTTGGTCNAPALSSAPTLDYLQSLSAFGATQAARVAAVQQIVGGLCVGFMNPAFDALGPVHQSLTENDLSGTAKLTWRANEDFMSYVSYSRGFKAGGFNLDRESQITGFVPGTALPANADGSPASPGVPIFGPQPNTAFKAETVTSYEIGAKTQWLKEHLSINAAAFDQTFDNFQLNTFIGTQFVVDTLPKVTSKGVDIDLNYITDIKGLSLQGGGTYADTVIGQFTAADLSNPMDFANLSNLPGQRLSFAPRVSLTGAATYETPVSPTMKMRFNVSAKYNSEYNTGSDLHPSKDQPAYTLVNARIGIGSKDDKWTLELWADNLFNTNYLQVGFNGPFQVASGPYAISDPQSVYDAFLGDPRTYGLTLRSKWK